MDYSFVTRRLATGAALSGPEDVAQLVAAGISTVIDCRAEYDDAPLFVDHPAIVYVYAGTADDGQPKGPEFFVPGITAALLAFSKLPYKVYAHCAQGVNRGPSMCYAILRAQGIPPDVAESLIRTARPQVGLRYKADADRVIDALL